MSKKLNIAFVMPDLVAGGAERIISFVSQNLNQEKFNATLVITGYEKNTVYQIKGIKVIYLNKSRVLYAIPSIFFYLIKNPTKVAVSSISHLNIAMAIISIFFRKTKFIGREATVLSYRKNETPKRKWYPASLTHHFYKRLDALICQSKDMAEDMVKNFGVSQDKIRVINNPISRVPSLKKEKKGDGNDVTRFITVGRLSEVKGHLRILKILSKFHAPFTYTIIGDGNQKTDIFIKVKEYNLMDKIIYIPFTKDVDKYLSKHDIFLQGSYVEGFPNALLESCVIGTPGYAFNVPGGTKEIIENGVNGFLIEDEAMFLKHLKENKEWIPEKVRTSVYEKFNQEKILQEYENLFLDIAK